MFSTHNHKKCCTSLGPLKTTSSRVIQIITKCVSITATTKNKKEKINALGSFA